MNNNKQKLLIEYLVSNADVFSLCQSIVNPKYFDPEYRQAIRFVLGYFHQYTALPTAKQIEAESEIALTITELTRDQIEYVTHEIEAFCRQQAIIDAVVKSADFIEKGEYGSVETLVKDALQVGISKSAGSNLFSDIESTLDEIIDDTEPYPLGWVPFDELLDGGPRRRELILLTANSGGGKSVVMANMGLDLSIIHGMRVLYLSLELPSSMIKSRYYTMITGIGKREFKLRKRELMGVVKAFERECGPIMVEKMPVGTTCNQIRSFLKEFEIVHGYLPDVILLDYLDLLGDNLGGSSDNLWLKDKNTTEQFREIILDFNMIGITASQQNRSAIGAKEITQAHISGGISKHNTVDISASIILDETMKAAGEIGFHFTKTRSSDGVGKTAMMGYDRKSIRIVAPKDDSMQIKLKQPSTDKGNASTPEQLMTGVKNDVSPDDIW